ncbi:methyltransferase domain-containing protein [Colletotrichum karsti]|uniref:Methyltransferase domain-containing protein n=1 Tax=Colletotrichum karsti TaxID=1095194 RepID=A0A9P6HVR1_9PEZI|nr:methyltransferase domain-containing protein [Colletotrichum karsti]KAF9871354.1 methyltransferase domain-containing protein [Colletotrichum karsti]
MQAVDNQIVFGDRNKAAPWYTHTLEAEISPEARDLLENYAHIKPEDVNNHVLTMRDKIWEVFPYPCVGHFSFLDLNLRQRPIYPSLVARLQEPDAKHLDVACCVGQDLRKLAYDGVPSQNITAIELEQGYIDAGYELFRDKETLKTRFVNADLMDDGSPTLNAMDGQFDSCHMGLCLHLWNREEQMKVLKRVIRLLKQKPGAVIVGHAVGHADGIDLPGMFNKPSLRHNLQTWESMWADISKETGTRWKLKTEISDQIGSAERASARKPTWWDKTWRFVAFEVMRDD